MDSFHAEIHVQAIDHISALLKVVQEVKLFQSDRDFGRLQQLLQQAGLAEEDKFVIGIKKLLNLIEMSRQDAEPGKGTQSRSALNVALILYSSGSSIQRSDDPYRGERAGITLYRIAK